MLGPRFLPSVLRHPTFALDGIMFGTDHLRALPIRWLVVDPGRHVMEVWRKATPSFPDSGRLLGASAFTNGPFSNYGSGSFLGASVSLLGDFVPAAMRRKEATRPQPWQRNEPRVDGVASTWMASNVYHYQATTPLGFVIGTASGIVETKVQRPRLHYFGRWGGHAFADYEIAQGDPFGLSEAVGGLYRGVTDYQPYMVDRFMRVGFWGLAPLKKDPILHEADVDDALDSYARSGHGCEGVIVFVGGWANTLRLTQLLAAIRVKDAVQIDGSDSLLLGRGTQLLLGSLMPPWKRLLQCWGIQFRTNSGDPDLVPASP